jgi:hypothetical protein
MENTREKPDKLLWATSLPALVTLFLMSIIVIVIVVNGKGDPLILARIGTFYSQGDPQGTQGYDGQFVYYIARIPDPYQVQPFLDVPAYRYQRILFPLLARYISLEDISLIPWVLPLINILAQTAGTWIVALLLAEWGVSPWYALAYGLWVGFSLAIRLDLPEPLAYALVGGAILSLEHKKNWLSWILFGLALFTKEVTILFVIAALLVSLLQQRWKEALGVFVIALVPFGIFQLWLYQQFGQPGIGSGGAMATPFEIIPLMGLIRIWLLSPLYGLAMVVVFGPAIILPSIWGIWVSIKKWLSGNINVLGLALFFNSLGIVFMPFSTFREPGGLLRFACGLVLAVVLFSGYYHYKRALNYSCLWIVLNVFLLKS